MNANCSGRSLGEYTALKAQPSSDIAHLWDSLKGLTPGSREMEVQSHFRLCLHLKDTLLVLILFTVLLILKNVTKQMRVQMPVKLP